jgi:serine phosphatase RsbU (regulator of sigma subunit)
MPQLQVVSGLNSGETYEVEAGETLLGRHPECQVVLRDSTISRRHARITCDGNRYVLDDLNSQHGTRVNGEPVHAPHRLRDGDEIQLSQITLVFRHRKRDVGDDHPSTIITSVDVIGEVRSPRDSHAAPKWRALLEITRSLGVSLDLKQILPKVLENVFRILPQATRGCILLVEGNGRKLKMFAARHADGDTDVPPPLSRTISQEVLTRGKAVLSTDAGEDERFQASDSVLELQMRSVLCAPLVGASDKPLGMIHLDAQDPTRPFEAEDLDVLVNIANLVGQAVDHAHLHETALQFDRRERDLATASQVQMHFLPQERPTLEGYELFDYYSPADAVGGDYFGYTPLPSGQLAIAVGDVAGHGVPAALLMARLCSEARYSLVTNILPGEAVEALNRQLSRQSGSFFITFALCVIDPVRHEMTIVNAGHMAPLLRHADTGQIEPVGREIAKPPLGIDAHIAFEQVTLPLQPGDLVMLYTDGVSETRDADGDMFGVERIEEVLATTPGVQQVVETLMANVDRFARGQEQEDDICVVALSRSAQ